jgi:hypothetical protein
MRRVPLKHPWRLAQTLDGLSINRSFRFSAYLDTLPLPERRVIEAAERAYVAKTQAANSIYGRTAQNFIESMQGVREHEPAEYRGFVS